MPTSNRIPLEQLEDMFLKMKSRPETNPDQSLLWGYFFFDSKDDRLPLLAERLKSEGFTIAGTHTAEDGTRVLHAEKFQKHTPESLYDLNTHFYELADSYDIDSYDGMDVGPLPTLDSLKAEQDAAANP